MIPTEKFSFRIDLIMVNESVTPDGKISGYMIPNPERYEWKTVNGSKYLYDKFDNLMIPEEEFAKAATNSKNIPIYSNPPEIKDLDGYLEARLPKMREFLDSEETTYEPANKSEDFLNSLNVDTAKFAILSVDLVGSTRLSQKLSTSDFAKIIQLLSRELDYVVSLHGGYVLKHVGDGLIAYFPEPNFIGMNDNSVDCAIAMKVVIEKGVNQVLKERQLPEVAHRIGIDSGEAAVRILGAPGIARAVIFWV